MGQTDKKTFKKTVKMMGKYGPKHLNLTEKA